MKPVKYNPFNLLQSSLLSLFDQASQPTIESKPIDSGERLHTELERLTKGRIKLVITDNRTRLASMRHSGGVLELRLHKAFLAAPGEVVRSVGKWITQPRGGVPPVMRDFAKAIPRDAEPLKPRKRAFITAGRVHDLRRLYDEVNACFFDGEIAAHITYGKDTSDQPVQIRRLGSWSHHANLITIHPLLDDPKVPDFVIAFTIYHEMLHTLQPPGHKRPHDLAFRRKERAHPEYDKVMAWRKRNEAHLNGGKRRRKG